MDPNPKPEVWLDQWDVTSTDRNQKGNIPVGRLMLFEEDLRPVVEWLEEIARELGVDLATQRRHWRETRTERASIARAIQPQATAGYPVDHLFFRSSKTPSRYFGSITECLRGTRITADDLRKVLDDAERNRALVQPEVERIKRQLKACRRALWIRRSIVAIIFVSTLLLVSRGLAAYSRWLPWQLGAGAALLLSCFAAYGFADWNYRERWLPAEPDNVFTWITEADRNTLEWNSTLLEVTHLLTTEIESRRESSG